MSDKKKKKSRNAIDAPTKKIFMVDPWKLTVIGLDTDDKGEHPLYDKRVRLPPDEKTVANIKFHGVHTPITVRKNGDAIEVVAGRRRVINAREANIELKTEGKELVRVPCMTAKAEDADLLGILISENEHRRDDTPMAKARKLKKLLALGRTETEASIVFGVSKQSIKNWSKLLDLSKKVQKAVDNGKLAASAAIELHELSHEEQDEQLEGAIAASGGKVTGRDIKERKSSNDENGASLAPKKRAIRRMLELEDDDLVDVSEEFLLGAGALQISRACRPSCARPKARRRPRHVSALKSRVSNPGVVKAKSRPCILRRFCDAR